MGYHGNNDYNGSGVVDLSLQNCFLKMGVPNSGLMGQKGQTFSWLLAL